MVVRVVSEEDRRRETLAAAVAAGDIEEIVETHRIDYDPAKREAKVQEIARRLRDIMGGVAPEALLESARAAEKRCHDAARDGADYNRRVEQTLAKCKAACEDAEETLRHTCAAVEKVPRMCQVALVLWLSTGRGEGGPAAPGLPLPGSRNEGYPTACAMSVPLSGGNHAHLARLE